MMTSSGPCPGSSSECSGFSSAPVGMNRTRRWTSARRATSRSSRVLPIPPRPTTQPTRSSPSRKPRTPFSSWRSSDELPVVCIDAAAQRPEELVRLEPWPRFGDTEEGLTPTRESRCRRCAIALPRARQERAPRGRQVLGVPQPPARMLGDLYSGVWTRDSGEDDEGILDLDRRCRVSPVGHRPVRTAAFACTGTPPG